MLNFANSLTLLRIVLLPVIIYLMFRIEAWAAYGALGLYVFGAFTDWLDGYIARKYNQITDFGTFLDPVCDKIYVTSILMTLVATGAIQGLGLILVILIFVREFTISGLREYLGPKKVAVPVSHLAKWKTTFQMLATGVYMMVDIIPEYGYEIGLGLLALATFLTWATALSYLRVGFQHMKEV